jgi:tyrosine decarboxylase/aspartate 1-decarboxylase
MGRSIIPTGAIIFRDQKDIEAVTTPVNYLSGGSTVHKTLVGTRSGAAAAAVWAVFRQKGREGFIEEVRSRMQMTDFFVESLEKIPGISLATKPVMNIIGVKSSRFAPKTLAEKLRSKGWAVSVFSEFVRIAVMPHVSRETVRKFCVDLSAVTGEQP